MKLDSWSHLLYLVYTKFTNQKKLKYLRKPLLINVIERENPFEFEAHFKRIKCN